MNLSKEQAKKLYSKLEYNFKKSKSALVEKLDSNSDIELSKEETQTLLKKLEYRFRKSNDSDLELIKKSLD
jgi:transposase